MSKITDFFNISLKKPVCIDGLNEDALRALVGALEISIADKKFDGFVVSTSGTQVKFSFGADGSFQGVYARLNGKSVSLIPGTGSKALQLFKGPHTSSNPGVGWEVETELTKEYLNQPDNPGSWEIFFASRTSVLNNVG